MKQQENARKKNIRKELQEEITENRKKLLDKERKNCYKRRKKRITQK